MATRTYGGQKVTNWAGGAWTTWGRAEKATLTTAFAGTNNDLTFTADAADVSGNSITIAFVVAGVSTPLTIGVAGNAITVNVATTAGSAASSTASQVLTALNASVPASALVDVALAAGNDGTGVVGAMAATPLAGGRTGGLGFGSGNWSRVKQGGKGYGLV